MNLNVSSSRLVHKPRILFVYSDERARYLLKELEDRKCLADALYVKISRREPIFWLNLSLCTLRIASLLIKRGALAKKIRVLFNRPRATLGKLYVRSLRRPMIIKEMSRRIERHIDSMTPRPDMILQWGSLFSPYTKTPKNSFAVMIDSYVDPPRIAMQESKLESPWSTLYDEDLYKLQKELYQKASCIFTLSRWCKTGLSREYSIDPSRIVAVGWGPLKKIATRGPLEKDHKTILAVGNDFLVKGFDILVRAAEYLEDFSITIVGNDSKKAFKDFSIPKNVQIRKVSQETLIKLYLKSELFFLFSRFEAAGHVLWEAQSYGCVVVGYDAYGISEAVVDNQSGILLKTRDPILVASEIRELYHDGNTLKRMQKAAVENYKENGTWNLVSKKIIQSICDRIEQIQQ